MWVFVECVIFFRFLMRSKVNLSNEIFSPHSSSVPSTDIHQKNDDREVNKTEKYLCFLEAYYIMCEGRLTTNTEEQT